MNKTDKQRKQSEEEGRTGEELVVPRNSSFSPSIPTDRIFKHQTPRYERDFASRAETSNPWSDKTRQPTSILTNEEQPHINNKPFRPISSVSGMKNGNQSQPILGETDSREDNEPIFVVGERVAME